MELGITQGYAYKLYREAMRQIVEPGVAEVRELELTRLDGMKASKRAGSRASSTGARACSKP